ncbi:MAG: peptidylprolyl isomerase [Sphingopyxis sp.]|jgi:peptidyl-prolyl cis-trans isomerase A (cyclophilin A)|nr:peptidylprolyl isomerase [Sphingopyxis sp.]
MIKRTIALALFVAASAAAGQTPLPATDGAPAPATVAAPAPAPVPALQHVRLLTSAGEIVIALEIERAPLTAANFLRYVDQRRFDGTTFYRAMPMGGGNGLIQGGARNDPARILRPVAHEPTTQTGLSHVEGAISMARAAPGSATGDFFIILGNQMTGLDANPAAEGDNLGFAVFGRVVAGMDIVRSIMAAPTDPNQGQGVMRGQMIAAPIRITSARRVAAPVAPPAAVAPPEAPPQVPPQATPAPLP